MTNLTPNEGSGHAGTIVADQSAERRAAHAAGHRRGFRPALSFSGEDVEILWCYRTPETRLAFALQLCLLRYPGRVLRQGEVMPLHLLAFIAEPVRVPTDAIGGFARRPQTRYEHLATLRSRFGFCDLTDAARAKLKQWLAPIALKTTDGHAVLVALAEEMRRRRIISTASASSSDWPPRPCTLPRKPPCGSSANR
jgi:TnpA family transposase